MSGLNQHLVDLTALKHNLQRNPKNPFGLNTLKKPKIRRWLKLYWGAHFHKKHLFNTPTPPYRPITSAPHLPSDLGPPIRWFPVISDSSRWRYFTSRKVSDDEVGRGTHFAFLLHRAASCQNRARTPSGPIIPCWHYDTYVVLDGNPLISDNKL